MTKDEAKDLLINGPMAQCHRETIATLISHQSDQIERLVGALEDAVGALEINLPWNDAGKQGRALLKELRNQKAK